MNGPYPQFVLLRTYLQGILKALPKRTSEKLETMTYVKRSVFSGSQRGTVHAWSAGLSRGSPGSGVYHLTYFRQISTWFPNSVIESGRLERDAVQTESTCRSTGHVNRKQRESGQPDANDSCSIQFPDIERSTLTLRSIVLV